MGSAMTGFLQGFLQTQQALQAHDEQRAKEQAELDLRKQDLDLRRQILKGQEASRQLQDQAHQLSMYKMLQELDDKQRARQEIASLGQPQPGMPVPMVDPATLSTPQAAPTATPALALPSNVSPAFTQKVQQVAARVGANPDDLMRIMHFETGGTFNPAEPNKAGSGATGLIQFTPGTALGLGTTTTALAKMTPEQQLDYVERYLTPFKGKIGTLRDAYLSVLYPEAVGKPDDTVLFKNGTTAYAQNIGLDRDDKGNMGVKGYVTVGDAVKAVQGAGEASGARTAQSSREQARFQADLEKLQVQRDSLMTQLNVLSQARVTTPGAQQELNRRIDNTRQQISLLNTQMEQTQKRLEPASEFGAILRKNNGNLDAALREQQAREVERKQQEQAAGMQMAAQRAAETERGKKEAEETFKAGQTLLDIKPQESRQYVDVKTGAPLPQSSKYQATKDRMDKGEVVFLDDQEIKAYRDISKMVPLLTQIRGQIEKVYGPGGIFENLTPAQRFAASLTGGMARLTQSNPELTELNRNIKGNVDNLRRSLQGQVGTQTEQDAQRGIQALAKVDGIPDSKEVAYGMYNALLQSVNGMMQFYLGNPEFQHGKLTPLGMTRQVTGEAVEVQ